MNKNSQASGWFLQPNLYQVANYDVVSLKKDFVIRRYEFDRIMDSIKAREKKGPMQHELILGKRGSGKSTLLKRIQVELEDDQELNKKYIPVSLAGEQAGVYRLSDLWYETLKEINLKESYPTTLKSFSNFKQESEYSSYLYHELQITLRKSCKQAILLLDNFDRILENLGGNANLFYEIVKNNDDIQIIGCSTRVDEHFWRKDKSLYEFFRRHTLEKLSLDEINDLFNQWCASMNAPQLNDYAIKNRGKIEALLIITDGLPRTLKFYIQFLVVDSTRSGSEYIYQVMDQISPLFQERLNDLTLAQRKIILEMAFIWEATSIKQLVDKCRMESKLISSYLKQLYDYGMVEKITTSTKNHLYALSNRFFNMWIIVTQGNPDQKRMSNYLITFLESWYDDTEIKSLSPKQMEGIQKGEIMLDKPSIRSKGVSQSKYLITKEADEMMDLSLFMSSYRDSLLHVLSQKSKDILTEINDAIEKKEYDKALVFIDEIVNEEKGVVFFLKGEVLYFKLELIDSEKYFLLAYENGHVASLNFLGILCTALGRKEEAEKYYLRATEKGDTDAIFNLALFYDSIRQIEDAERYYLMAIKNGNNKAFEKLGILYKNQWQTEKADWCFLKAIEKGSIKSLYNLYHVFKRQGRVKEAEKYRSLAIERGEIEAIYNMAILCDKQGRQEDAETYYLLLIEKDKLFKLYDKATYGLSVLYKKQGRIEEAEKYTSIGSLNSTQKILLPLTQKGDKSALYDLAILNWNYAMKREEALEYIKKYNRTSKKTNKTMQWEAIFEIWNGIFENIEEKIAKIFRENNYNNVQEFIICILYLGQKKHMLQCFRDPIYGSILKSNYTLLHYATLFLCDEYGDNLKLKIPIEVNQTVQKIVETVRAKNKLYLK